MRYTLRQLEIFIAVARHESVSRAADALALSQSATRTALGELGRQFDTQMSLLKHADGNASKADQVLSLN